MISGTRRAGCPLPASIDGFAPAGKQIAAYGFRHGRLEDPVGAPETLEFLAARPETGSETGKISGAESGGFDVRGPDDAASENVGLKLHEEIVGRSAAV